MLLISAFLKPKALQPAEMLATVHRQENLRELGRAAMRAEAEAKARSRAMAAEPMPGEGW